MSAGLFLHLPVGLRGSWFWVAGLKVHCHQATPTEASSWHVLVNSNSLLDND